MGRGIRETKAFYGLSFIHLGQVEEYLDMSQKIPKNEIVGAIITFIGAFLTLYGFGMAMYSLVSGWPGPYFIGLSLMIAGILIAIAGLLTMRKKPEDTPERSPPDAPQGGA